MNWGLLLVFILIQFAINNFLGPVFFELIPGNSIYEIVAFYLLAAIIIAFFGAFFSTPKGYRKDFFRHPAFHKTMLVYFVIFFMFDAVMILLSYVF